MFDRSTMTTTLNVNIVDDSIHEQSELFYGQLSSSEDAGVLTLNPASTNISILDNEGIDTFNLCSPM